MGGVSGRCVRRVPTEISSLSYVGIIILLPLVGIAVSIILLLASDNNIITSCIGGAQLQVIVVIHAYCDHVGVRYVSNFLKVLLITTHV